MTTISIADEHGQPKPLMFIVAYLREQAYEYWFLARFTKLDGSLGWVTQRDVEIAHRFATYEEAESTNPWPNATAVTHHILEIDESGTRPARAK